MNIIILAGLFLIVSPFFSFAQTSQVKSAPSELTPKVLYVEIRRWLSPGMPVFLIDTSDVVTAESLAHSIEITQDGVPVGFRVISEDARAMILDSTSKTTDVKKAANRTANIKDVNRRWLFTPKTELSPDQIVTIRVRPGLMSPAKKGVGTEDRELGSFKAFPPFQFVGVSCEEDWFGKNIQTNSQVNCDSKNKSLLLRFSAPVDIDSFKKECAVDAQYAGGAQSEIWPKVNSKTLIGRELSEEKKTFSIQMPLVRNSQNEFILKCSSKVQDHFGRDLPMGFRFEVVKPKSVLPVVQAPAKMSSAELETQIQKLVVANDLRGLEEIFLNQPGSDLKMVWRSYCELPIESEDLLKWIFRKHEETFVERQRREYPHDKLLDCLRTSWKNKRWRNFNAILGQKDRYKITDSDLFSVMASEIKDPQQLKIFLSKESIAEYVKNKTLRKAYSSELACKKNEVTNFQRDSSIWIDSEVTQVRPVMGPEEKDVLVTLKKMEILGGELPESSFEVVWPKYGFDQYLYFREVPSVGDRFLLPLKKDGNKLQVVFQDCILSSTKENRKHIRYESSKFDVLKKFSRDICSANQSDPNRRNEWLKVSSQTKLYSSTPQIDQSRDLFINQIGKIEMMFANGSTEVYQGSDFEVEGASGSTYEISKIYCDAGILEIRQTFYEAGPELLLVDLYDGTVIGGGQIGFSKDEKYFFASDQVSIEHESFYPNQAGSSSIYFCGKRSKGIPCKAIWKDVGGLGYVDSVKWNGHQLTVKFYDPSLTGVDPSIPLRTLQCVVNGETVHCKGRAGAKH